MAGAVVSLIVLFSSPRTLRQARLKLGKGK
jgi:hypothetical protein